MIVSISLVCVYLVALFAMLFIHAGKKQRQAVETGVTRKINPKLGCLGVLGFLGVAGFWTYPVDGTVFPFAFFLFFGFFGFSYRITFGVMLAALIILCQGKLFRNLEYTLIAAIIILSLALGLGIFLSEYLLFRYDHDDQAEEGEE